MIRLRNFRTPFARLLIQVQARQVSEKGNHQGNASASSSTDEENIKTKILDASLSFVERHGWTKETISAGAERANYPDVIHGLFDDASSALVFHLYKKLNAQLVDHLEKNPRGDAKVGDFVHEKLRFRLEMVVPYADRWPEALSVMSKPLNVPKSAQLLMNMCDDIWFHAGDRSSDFSWYTKRTSLMAVYAASQLHLVQDKSPNFDETWAFMKRRLVDVRTVGTTISKAQESISSAGDVGYSLFHTVRNMLGMNSTRRS